jgi:hypothetical protein
MYTSNNIESIKGKHLGEAANTVAAQIKYVSEEMGVLRSLADAPLDTERAEHLRHLLSNIGTIRENVYSLLSTASKRLSNVEQGVKLRLQESRHTLVS